MDKNEFSIDFIGCLQQAKSKKQINADIRQLEKTINMLRITGMLAKGDTKKEINGYIKVLGGKLNYVKLKGKLDEKSLKREIDKSLHNMTFKEIDALNIDGSKTKLKIQKVMADVKAYAEKTPITVNVQLKKEKLGNDLTTFLNKNSKIRESGVLLTESERIRELIDSVNDKGTLRNATDAFSLFKSEVVATGFAGKSTSQKIKDMLTHITKIGGFFGLASLAINNFRKSLNTLKSNDTILTEISKTSEMAKQQLVELGNEAFKTASKYGQLSSNYLLGVQEMARSGYEDTSKELGELSLLAQSSGDMTAESANNYLLATDAAYKYSGSVKKLNAALDGANYISNKNSASLTDIADATRVSASFAANAGVAIDELTAAEATMIATTKRSGSEMGRAFRSIILNLQQVSGEFDGEIIDEEQLKKVEDRCHSLGVELEYVKDGVATLRNPMEVLKELADVYNSLPDNSAEKQGLISDIGGKYHANALSSLLSRWDLYEKMLSEYSQGAGSALEEAEKTANSWEGRLNSLQNSFDSFINTLTNKEAILGGISFFDRLIQGAEELTKAIGELPIVITALNSAMVATNKDYGITQVWNKDKKKIDLQGNIFGIDFTAIKNMKKHFSEAKEAIAGWNAELVAGNADINDFGGAVVQNSAQLKEYLSTCSKDAPASLEGYKAHLKATGVDTDALRLKTILLNSAITMLGGWAIQAVITGFYELSQVSNNVAEKAKELGESFKSTKSDIESYKSKIEELYMTINDSGSSIKDVTNARKTLMSIQDELIDKFGTEKGAIDDVTEAINGQTDALDRLTRTKWQEIKNEFNDGGFWNNAANFFQGTNNIERMLNEYGEQNIVFPWVDYAGSMTKLTDDMVAKLENIGISIKVSTDDSQGIRDFNSLTESINDTRGEMLYISGNAEEIYNKILSLQNLISGDDSFGKLYENIERHANSYKELTDKYKDFYDQYILQEKIFSDDSKYTDTYKNIIDAAEKYNKAFISGNEEEIKKASDEYAGLLSTAMTTAVANGDSDVATYFESMYPALKSIVDGWNFNVAFDANTDNLQEKVQAVLDELRDKSDRALTAEEILGLGEENEQYQALISIAHSYNMTIEEMIGLLKERNLVSAMDYQGLVGLFGQDNIDKLLPEDLEVAYTIKNVGNITFEQLQAEIQRLKDTVSETDVSETAFSFSYDKLSEIPQKLSEVENAYKTAQEALESYNEKGYYTMDVIDSILSLENEYINILVDENGQLQINSDSMNHLAAIKIEAAKASIYQETCEELVRIKTLDTSLAAQELALVNGILTESAYETARALYKEVIAMGGANALLAGNVWNAATKKVKVLDNQLKALNQGTYNVGKLTISDSATKAAEDATKKIKDYIEAYLKFQKQSLESGRIDYNTYCNTVSNLLKSMYKDGKISAQDYHDYVGQMLEMQLDVYKKTLSAVLRRYDKEIQKINDVIDGIEKQNDTLEEQKSLMESAIDAVVSYYDSLIAAEQQSIDNLEAKNDSIQEQIDKYDSLISVADKVYGDEQKSLEEQQSLLQDKIDALNDENDALDLQYRKEQALIALRRAQTQRTKKVYNGTEFVYDTDKEAIREAQKNLQDIKTEELISDLEKEKNALQETIDELQKYRDALGEISDAYEQLIDEQNTIDLLGNDYKTKILGVDILDWEKLKDRYVSANKEMADNTVLIDGLNKKIQIWDKEKEQWSSLTQSVKDNVNKRAANQQFGADWEQQINEGRFVAYDDFKNRYLSIENQINDNTQLIETLEQKKIIYSELKEQWSSITDAYEQSQENLMASQLLGENWESDILSGRIDTLNSFRNNYVSIQQAIADAAWNSANAQIKAAQEAAKAASGTPQTTPDISKTDSETDDTKKKVSSGGKTTPPKLVSNRPGNYMTMYGSGTENARKGMHLVSEHDGDEIIIRNDDSAVVAHGEQLYPFEGGETVIKASESKKILTNIGELVPVEKFTFGKGDKAIQLTPEELMQRWQSIMPNYASMVQIPKFEMPKFEFPSANRENNVSVSMGDIHLHEVKDADSLSRDIINNFPNKVYQKLYRH